jgi:transketolase
MSATDMRAVFAETSIDLLDRDPRVAVVLSEISGQYFEAAMHLHPDRVVNVGIREQLSVNVGAGMALTGMRPIVHTFASFLVERSFEQLKLGFSHQDVGGVLVSAGASYDISSGGRTHQAPGDVALVASLPDWRIHVPGHADEAATLLRDEVGGEGRAYVRLSGKQNRAAYPTGRMTVLRRGSQGTVVAVGPTLDDVLAATDGWDVTVLYASTVRPFDTHTLVDTLGFADVVVVEPYLEGTSADVVSDALRHRPHRLLSLGVPHAELRSYGTPREHQAAHALDAAGIRRSIADFLAEGDRT